MKLFRSVLTGVFLMAMLVGCARSNEPSLQADATPESYWLEIKQTRIDVELATSPLQMMRGLMGREHLPENTGMFFVHQRQEPLAYWMKNMKIAIDIIYLDRSGTIVTIWPFVQPCQARRGHPCQTYPSSRPAQFVLEVPSGTALRNKWVVGDRIDPSTDLQKIMDRVRDPY